MAILEMDAAFYRVEPAHATYGVFGDVRGALMAAPPGRATGGRLLEEVDEQTDEAEREDDEP
jgi:hypothetical protein